MPNPRARPARPGRSRLVLALLLVGALALAGLGVPGRPVAADGGIEVTDVVGRSVRVKAPVQRLILAEARSLYLVALLEPDDPFARIVGWGEDLKSADLDTYERYRARFPQLETLPIFGSVAAGAFSVERAIALQPDVVVLHFDSYERARELGLIDQLAAAGIPTVITDFRQQPLENTIPSVLLLGRLLGREERAREFADYYFQQLDLVFARVDRLAPPRPLTFLYRAAGLIECCATFGRGNLGVLVERAGGRNLGSELLPSWAGTLNPETVLTADPDVIIVTGSNWTHYAGKVGTYVSLGYSAQPATAREQLKRVVAETSGWAELKAVRGGRIHAIWHQFYNSPYHFVALQQFAKWLHPETFEDVDPRATFEAFHRRFLPIEAGGAFWVSLGD